MIELADEEPGRSPTTPVSTPVPINDDPQPPWLTSKPPSKKKHGDDRDNADVQLFGDVKSVMNCISSDNTNDEANSIIRL